MRGTWRVTRRLVAFSLLWLALVGCGSEGIGALEDASSAPIDALAETAQASDAVSDALLARFDAEEAQDDLGPGSADVGVDGLESDDAESDDVDSDDAESDDVESDDVEAADEPPLASYPELPVALTEAIMADMVEAKVPGLSACIVKEEALFWCGGFGNANLALELPVTEHTPFLLASISKLFTSTVVLQLIEDGVIDLEADVGEYLGWELTHPISDAPVTMRQLLTHHSGIKDNWSAMGDFYAYGSDPALSLQEVIEGYFQPTGFWYEAESNFATDGPGESFLYSNMAVALAAHIVERVTDQDFAERSNQTLLGPLGLTQSAWRLSEFPSLDVVAMPYQWKDGAYAPTGHYTFADYPNGGLRASAHDLARFLLAHLQGGELDGVRILEQESVDAALSEQATRSSGPQGWMWYRLSWGGDKWWGHGGAEKGVWTEVFFRESDKMGFVTLANGDANDPNPMYAIQDALMAWAESL